METTEGLSLKQIQYFSAVAEYGSFRQASARLNITQPTLSNQVAAMERAEAKHPDTLFYIMRVGYRAAGGIGARPQRRRTP